MREQSFEDSGEQGNLAKGEQMKPPRRKRDDTMTEGETLEYATEWLEKKEEYFEEKENGGGWFSFSFGGKSSRSKRGEEDAASDDEEVEDLEDFDEKPRPAEGEKDSETDAVEGYGMPTKGIYDASEGGYKTFGTTGQGEFTVGVKDISDTVAESRTMIINVLAVGATGVDALSLKTGNYDFLEEYEWGSAKALSASVALLGLISAYA